MKQDATEARIRRGYLILAALVAVGLLVFYSDALLGLFRDHVDVVAIVEGTGGVRVGSPVLVEGIEAGRVRGIRFVDMGGRGAVALDVRLEERARSLVRLGSLAYTARDRFVGEPIVRISAAPPTMPAIAAGDTLFPAERVSPETLLARSREIPAALDSLTASFRELDRLARAARPRLATLTEGLAAVSSEVEVLRGFAAEGEPFRWLDDPELPERVRALRARADDLAQAADRLDRYGADGELGRRAAALGDRTERLIVALDDVERRLADADGFLHRARRDSALAVAIRGVRAQIDSLRAEGMGFALRTLIP